MSREEILLVYDRECPACNAYCQVVRIRESVGDLRIVDAREHSEVRDEITSRGLDIDQGHGFEDGWSIVLRSRCNSRACPDRESFGDF